MNSNPRHGAALSQSIADQVSLQSLLVCWQREIAKSSETRLAIDTAKGRLDIQLAEPRHCGPPCIEHMALDAERRPTEAESLDLLLERLGEISPSTAPELVRRARSSRDRIAGIVRDRLTQPDDPVDFLAAEQALIFGHWMHPAPKALGGISVMEEHETTPDWRGALRLHALSVEAGLFAATQPGLARHLPGFDVDPGDGRMLLPAHPLTLDRLSRDPQIAAILADERIRDLGPVGPSWHATSSVRTLWNPDCAYMVKVSLPVTVTNSQRMNKRHELLAGALMAQRIAGLADRFGPMRLISDPHWLTLDLPGRSETGFEIILRDNPYRDGRGGQVVQVAALSAAPLPGRRSMLARAIGTHDPVQWFGAYMDVALTPLLRLYDQTGIGFEAHQQNALLDLSQGLPCRCDLRDNQGFFISEDMADAEQRTIPQLVYPRTEVEDALGYTLIVNQVFSVIHRLAKDGLVPESRALALLAAQLERLAIELPGHGGKLARRWLTEARLPMKGNLLTQLGGVDELHIPGERAPYVQIPNPIAAYARNMQRLEDVA
ncbi:IucA/IucC family protein [Paracoccus saliphilus]|uniref:Siderophore synthetase component n=1 Tax=Paracoccus saliphilus TaxID=405559 RepID=A0AA46A3T4_9RHOB|nr:IucA/IucC family protein [Paracoccus saliphilus]WCR03251.1 hypothetical protein JHX88_00205 [Paracoccus saliphilus]SIS50254.1 Siderophore synthetase component [Paracoccus saliphilus]